MGDRRPYRRDDGRHNNFRDSSGINFSDEENDFENIQKEQGKNYLELFNHVAQTNKAHE